MASISLWRWSRAIKLFACIAFMGLGSALVADPLPGVKVPSVRLLERNAASLDWHPGRVTVFSFFAFWCDTWKTQCPRLVEARGALSGLPVDFYTVSVDGRWSDIAGYDARLPCALDLSGWAKEIGVDRVPTTVVVDESGTVRWSHSGVVRVEDLLHEARAAFAPRSAGEVMLRFDDFSDSSGGFKLLDTLRRLDVRAELFVPRGERLSSALARQTSDMGMAVFGGIGDRPTRVVDPFDLTRPGAKELVRRVVLAARAGTTVMLHAGAAQTLDALPEMVEGLRRAGFSIGLELARP
jgi:hypothetical protein